MENIKDIISKMTLEEKAALTSGFDNWQTKGVERLNVPKIWMSDGPNGLRKEIEQKFVVNEAYKAVTYPTAVTAACSFNEELMFEYGNALGKEAAAKNVAILLGPALNIKRSPLCGRNFEYYSEDPYLSGKIAASVVKGIQSANVGACVKHFAANNQEYHRMVTSAEIDEKTLREIYLTGFEIAIKEGNPVAVMSAYNKVNGIYASHNKKLLTDILRTEWKYKGLVISDWCAVSDRVEAIKAGCDLTMPIDTWNDHKLVEAVNNGNLSEEKLNESVERILNTTSDYLKAYKETSVDLEENDKISQKVAEESIVLLKNDDVLPLNEKENVLYVGPFVKKPRIIGGGSAFVNAYKTTSFYDVKPNINYLEGFSDDNLDSNTRLLKEVLEKANSYDKVVVFAGLPEIYESEGYDRLNLDLPNYQNELIEKLSSIHKQVIVVLHNGSAVSLPWESKVAGIVGCHLAGEAIGKAFYNILFGHVNPSGRLAETYPLRLEDTPTYLSHFGTNEKVYYSEGLFVGYRYYTSRKINVLYPFGYGLSYTKFEYSNLKLSRTTMSDEDELLVSVDVKNVGSTFGKEVVQLYVRPRVDERYITRPVRELKGFKKIGLNPNETKTVTFTLNKRSFAGWNEIIHDWHVEKGEYGIQICRDASTVVLMDTVFYNSKNVHEAITFNSPIDVLDKTKLGHEFLLKHKDALNKIFGKFYNKETNELEFKSEIERKVTMELHLYSKNLYSLPQFIPGITLDDIQKLIIEINNELN